MGQERFPQQEEHERTGGQHGTRNTDTPPQESKDPQLKRVHENVKAPDVPHGNDVGVEDGGARHRTQ